MCSDERHPRPGTKRAREDDDREEEEDLNESNFDEVREGVSLACVVETIKYSSVSLLGMEGVCLPQLPTRLMTGRPMKSTIRLTTGWTVAGRFAGSRSSRKR